MRRGQIWNHITYDGRVRIPLMLKGMGGKLYDSGDVLDWQHDLICDCGYTWSVTDRDLRGKTLRKAFPVCCGRPECLYTPPPKEFKSNLPKPHAEPKALITYLMPMSIHTRIEKLVAGGRFKNRSGAITYGLRYWLDKDTATSPAAIESELEAVPIEEIEHELGI